MLLQFMKFIRNRDDKAGGTLVTGIFGIIFFCLCVGFGADVAKNAYLKDSFSSMAQKATETAVKTVDSRGSLTVNNGVLIDTEGGMIARSTTPDKFYYEYMAQRNENEVKGYITPQCSTRPVIRYGSTTKSNAKLPYMVIRLEPDRQLGSSANSVVFVSEGGMPPGATPVAGTYNPAVKYKVISAEVWDSSMNFMLSMFGVPCQDYDSKVSAITFGSNQDN